MIQGYTRTFMKTCKQCGAEVTRHSLTRMYPPRTKHGSDGYNHSTIHRKEDVFLCDACKTAYGDVIAVERLSADTRGSSTVEARRKRNPMADKYKALFAILLVASVALFFLEPFANSDIVAFLIAASSLAGFNYFRQTGSSSGSDRSKPLLGSHYTFDLDVEPDRNATTAAISMRVLRVNATTYNPYDILSRYVEQDSDKDVLLVLMLPMFPAAQQAEYRSTYLNYSRPILNLMVIDEDQSKAHVKLSNEYSETEREAIFQHIKSGRMM